MANSVISTTVDSADFLRRSLDAGYSMQPGLIEPDFCKEIADELAMADLLRDGVRLQPSEETFEAFAMRRTKSLHDELNQLAATATGGSTVDQLPFFNVRLFNPGAVATTIHRNNRFVGPWAIGVTLFGASPFNVYGQSQLPLGEAIDIMGDDTDPLPEDTMLADAGSAWSLYTGNELKPHSGGMVVSETSRALLIFCGLNN